MQTRIARYNTGEEFKRLARPVFTENILGVMLREFRLCAYMSQAQLGSEAGTLGAVISAIELGKRGMTAGMGLRIAVALDLDNSETGMLLSCCRRENAPKTALGAAVRDMRLSRQWTQNDLAIRAGISKSYVNFIELGESSPSLSIITRIADAFGLRGDERNRFLALYVPNIGGKEFGQFVRESRIELGLKQKELGELIGVSGAMVSVVELGKRKISKKYVPALVEVLRPDQRQMKLLAA